MNTAHIAAVVESHPGNETTRRLIRLLDFLGISWRVFNTVSELEKARLTESLGEGSYSVIGSITEVADLIEDRGEIAQQTRSGAQSLFCYVSEDVARCSQLLKVLTKCTSATLASLKGAPLEVEVSKCCPSLTGPMHGVRTIAKAGSNDHALATEGSLPISTIIGAPNGPFFFDVEYQGLRTFVSCSAALPELERPLSGRYYDVKDDFLSTVPIVMYLKWAFRDSCWRTSEPGACLIIDDPILKTKYGFCDFRQIDAQMRELGFSTNISVIPWNWRRTSDAAAALVRESEGRFSISIHGCDHTGSEFATSAVPTLNRKVALAKQRMERHQKRSAVSHDPIMVFPQGAFSRESLAVLQQHQFLAAVNTEVLPMNGARETVSIGDVWNVAIVKYGSFPVFTRRYPSHGLENFAFDLLLGKPCFIVEHHQFFKDGGREALKFISALNSLNCRLQWGGLGQVLRRTYQRRVGSNGEVQIRMFANELLLRNESQDGQSYQIQKANEDSAGIEKILVDGYPVEWEMNNESIGFSCTIPPNTEILIQIQYRSSLGPVTEGDSLKSMTKTALRRFSCEFRDTFLSRHARLLSVAQKTKSYLARR
jgi:hypothetical protein